MNRALRRRHLVMLVLLAVVSTVLVVVAVRGRRPIPVTTLPSPDPLP
jgi:hypothetical protein